MDIPVNPVEAYLEDYRKWRNPAQNTLVNKKSTLDRYFRWVEEQNLDWTRMNEGLLVGYAGNLKTKGASRKNTWIRLRGFYAWAVRKGFVKINPASNMYLPPRSAPRAARKGFSREEVQALMDALPVLSDSQRFLVTYMLVRPVRISEMLKLRICDVDLRHNRIFIGFDPDDPDPAKTEGSCRYQTIPERSLPILKRLMLGRGKEDKLFGISKATATRVVMDIFKKAGIEPEGRGSHAFRHTVIMRLIFENRIDVAIVAKMAGNSPITIYKDYLSQIPERQLESAMKGAEKF